MAALARRIVVANGLESSIKVVLKRSDELIVATRPPAEAPESAAAAPATSAATRRRAEIAARLEPVPDLADRVDVIVTEIFDSQLLGEGLLPTMRDAVPRLLKPGGRVIPARATVFGQLVESPVIASMSHPGMPAVPDPEAAVGFSAVVAKVLALVARLDAQAVAATKCPPFAANGGGSSSNTSNRPVHELHVDVLHERGLLRPLGRAVPLLSFDLANPPQGDRCTTVQVNTRFFQATLMTWL